MTTESFPTLVDELVKRWHGSGAAIRPGNVRANVIAFERERGVELPADLVEYFVRVDGMAEGSWDEHCIRFWPLAEMKTVVQELGDDPSVAYRDYFVFADYSLWAHAYAIRLDSKNDVVIVGGDKPIRVASSFTDFVEKYLTQPMSLFPSAESTE
jgi:hypothetical protein